MQYCGEIHSLSQRNIVEGAVVLLNSLILLSVRKVLGGQIVTKISFMPMADPVILA